MVMAMHLTPLASDGCCRLPPSPPMHVSLSIRHTLGRHQLLASLAPHAPPSGRTGQAPRRKSAQLRQGP